MSNVASASAKTWFQRLRQNVAARPVPAFLLGWFVLNVLQVSFLQLTSDEGYYWFYAQHLQWGYYDHPPLVALLIRAGSYLFPGELGVRFFNVVLSTVALGLFFLLLPPGFKRRPITYAVVLSAALLHYLSFIVFPDGPLLTFSLLFLVVYKRFLQRQNVLVSIGLGVALALMAYSKYHGALVLLFTVMANPRLLKTGYFYLSLLTALLLFAPHLWWQYSHGFPTFSYHLSGRTGQWSLRHVGEYLSQQVVAIGPGLIFLPFVCRAKDLFERTLLFIIVGTFLFFLVSSFKTFVHFHWTSIALYPLLYFAVGYYAAPTRRRLFQWLVVPFVVLFFAARVLLLLPFPQGLHAGEDYYKGRKAWANELSAVAGGRPVFMPNNLREASLYSFYSRQTGVTLYNRPEKKSQYELWGYEDSLQGKAVLFVTKYAYPGATKLPTTMGQTLYYKTIPSFRSYYTGIEILARMPGAISRGASLAVSLEIVNKRDSAVVFDSAGSVALSLVYSLEQDGHVASEGTLSSRPLTGRLLPGRRIPLNATVPIAGLPPGRYVLYIGLSNGVLPAAFLSRPATVVLE